MSSRAKIMEGTLREKTIFIHLGRDACETVLRSEVTGVDGRLDMGLLRRCLGAMIGSNRAGTADLDFYWTDETGLERPITDDRDLSTAAHLCGPAATFELVGRRRSDDISTRVEQPNPNGKRERRSTQDPQGNIHDSVERVPIRHGEVDDDELRDAMAMNEEAHKNGSIDENAMEMLDDDVNTTEFNTQTQKALAKVHDALAHVDKLTLTRVARLFPLLPREQFLSHAPGIALLN